MSKAYEIALKESKNGKVDMRKFCQRPGKKMKDGTPAYTTEQQHKRECDVNEIIKKYDTQGVITNINTIEAKFGDFRIGQYQDMINQIDEATAMFQKLPSNIRNRFDNDAGKLLDFMDDPKNREEAIDLGLIDKLWTPETDGLGEHITDDSQRKKKPEKTDDLVPDV